MIKLWVAGVAVLATAGVAGALVVGSSGGDEDALPAVQVTATESATTSYTPTASALAVSSPTVAATSGETTTYTDPTYGYSLEYPSTWRISTEDLETGVILYSYDAASAVGDGRPVPPDKLKAFFWVAEGVHKPLEQWLAEGDNSPGQIAPPTLLSQTETLLGGKQALVRVIESEGLKYISYYVPLGADRVFVVNGGHPDSQVWPQFVPVLDSIRFAT